MLAAPLVFRAPEGPAAREARRPHFVRRRASKPARALRSLRRPPHRRRLRCCVVSARPCCRPRPPQPGPPDPPAPSTPAVLCCCVWLSASSRSPPWPRRRPSSFARNSLATISNIEFRSLQLQRFQTLLKFLPIELCARFLWSCPCRPRAALHTGGAWSLMWLGASSRSPARPRLGPTGSPRPHRPASALAHIAAELLNFACNSPATISNIEFTALKLQCFQTLLNLLPIELHATFQ